MNGSRAFFAWASPTSLKRNTATRRNRDNHEQERMLQLLPLTAADCASSTSETTSEKPKTSQIRLPDPRWSNRAYPQNHADLNPRSHLGPEEIRRDRNEPLFGELIAVRAYICIDAKYLLEDNDGGRRRGCRTGDVGPKYSVLTVDGDAVLHD